MKRHQRAFTLTEILIVIALTALLVVIAIPGYQRARREGNQRTCRENLARIDGAKVTWALENDLTAENPTPGWDDLIAPGKPGRLEEMPVCPLDPNSDGGTYTINPLNSPPECSQGKEPYRHTFPIEDLRQDSQGS